MPDVIIVGGGLAGLYTALHIDPGLSVLIVTKEDIDISNSWLAQGGIAAAISEEDAPEVHFEDTMVAGAHLCKEEAVRVLVDEGPRDIKELVDMRVPFDLDEDGDLAITREGGHKRRRIVHAGGDATGRETVKVLGRIAAGRPNIELLSGGFFVNIILSGGRCAGIRVIKDGKLVSIQAGNVVLCTGGTGRVFSRTTNPSVATGDGIGACVRAGIILSGMEFVQFHPTALYEPSADGRLFLISEAVRGEGGLLRNRDGVRFMEGKHPLAELAPRDIVSREIEKELLKNGGDCVYIDITHKNEDYLKKRFPNIYGECLKRDINMAVDFIPVRPAQHYMVGGINVDLYSRTSLPGVFSVGEAASTGVHGANRLASNSMLECLVFGRRAAEAINGCARFDIHSENAENPLRDTERDFSEYTERCRRLCDRYAGVIRTLPGLQDGLAGVLEISHELQKIGGESKNYWEALNIAQTAGEIFRAALSRKESVGTHYVG